MELRFGFDFSRVRIHTGQEAVAAARSLAAAAFTLGPNIFFNSDRYQPNGPGGLGLLAHELTHVGQQSGDTSGQVIQRALIPYRQLTWADFQGAVPKDHDPREGAGIRNPFDLASYNSKEESHDKGQKCGPKTKQLTVFDVTHAPNPDDLKVKPAATMDTSQSWAEERYLGDGSKHCHSKTTDQFQTCMSDEVKERARLLKHEQGHFDIAQAIATNARADIQKIATPVTATECGLSAAQDAAESKYGPLRDKLSQLQSNWMKLKDTVENEYDTKTGHGGNPTKQTAWEDDIKKGLTQYQPKQEASPSPTATAPAATAPATSPSPQPAPKKVTP